MIPGLTQAKDIEARLHNLGIQDVQLFFDNQTRMWAVCQVHKHGGILLPDNYQQDGIKPYILWWCKNDTGRYRTPNDQDFIDIVTVVKRAPNIWEKGEKRADEFDAKDAEKDRKHQEKFHDRIHAIAPAMKKAIKAGKM